MNKSPKCKCQTCPNYKNVFVPKNNNSLQRHCLGSDACIAEFYQSNKKKIENKTKIIKRDNHKEMKDRLKTTGDYKKDLQTEINTICRLIDNGQPCIATGSTTGKRNAGHYISVSANDSIRFNLHNIHIQSEHSNCYKSGDTLRYQDGIINIYGQKYLDEMNYLKQHPPLHLSKDELKEKIIVARQIVKELTKLDLTYSPHNRILLRRKYNTLLEIYQ